jgi:hypothetical protein
LLGATNSGPTLISTSLVILVVSQKADHNSLASSDYCRRHHHRHMYHDWSPSVQVRVSTIHSGREQSIADAFRWKHTDKLVTKLVRLTFEAQLLPTCLAMAYLIEWSKCTLPSDYDLADGISHNSCIITGCYIPGSSMQNVHFRSDGYAPRSRLAP